MQINVLMLIMIIISDWKKTQVEGIMGCMKDYSCVPLSQCTTASDIAYPCAEDESNNSNICCAPENITITTAVPSIVGRTGAFPETCGVLSSADKITGGEVAGIGQFPWMALLGYQQQGLDFLQFLCGGSIITSKYVLTAAHCTSIDPRFRLLVVRLGEYNLDTEKDCEDLGRGLKLCAEPYVDRSVDKIIPHRNYDNTTLENDIALIKLKRELKFTEFIYPICMPFDQSIDYESTVNGELTVSGWGKTDSINIGGSSILMFTHVDIWDQGRCNISVPPRIRPIRDSQLCANGVKKQDACKGDSGGPLINRIATKNDLKNYQIGIVSFSSAQICGNAELPTIYTRVNHYLDWIVQNVV